MQLVNRTPWQAMLQIADLGEPASRGGRHLQGDIRSRRRMAGLSPAAEPMPIPGDPIETPFGTLHGELYFKKAGADLCVLGTIRRTTPVREVMLTLTASTFVHRLLVTGDRVWMPTGDKRQPLAPIASPTLHGDAARVPARVWRDRRLRRLSGTVAGQPDRPRVLPDRRAGARAAVAQHRAGERTAHPSLGRSATRCRVGAISDELGTARVDRRAGRRPEDDGQARRSLALQPRAPRLGRCRPCRREIRSRSTVLLDWPLTVTIPRELVHLRVRAGDDTFEVTSHVDGVFIWADAAKLIVTHRAMFSYVFRPRELRNVTATVVAI